MTIDHTVDIDRVARRVMGRKKALSGRSKMETGLEEGN